MIILVNSDHPLLELVNNKIFIFLLKMNSNASSSNGAISRNNNQTSNNYYMENSGQNQNKNFEGLEDQVRYLNFSFISYLIYFKLYKL